MTCLLVISQARAEVSGTGNCAQMEDGSPNAECKAAMGSTNLLQKTADGLKTEVAWEEESAQQKSEESLLISREDTMAEAEKPRPRAARHHRHHRSKTPARRTRRRRARTR